MRRNKSESHEIWKLFTKILVIRDLSRNVFHGSVLNDILEGSHFSNQFVEAVESLAVDLTMHGVEEIIEAINQFKEYFAN